MIVFLRTARPVWPGRQYTNLPSGLQAAAAIRAAKYRAGGNTPPDGMGACQILVCFGVSTAGAGTEPSRSGA